MRHPFLICLLFSFGISLGCGASPEPTPPPAPTPEALIKQQISILNQMATAMENGASEKEMKIFETRSKAVNTQIEELELTPQQKQEILKKHQAEMQAALDRIRVEMEKRIKGTQE